MRTTTPAGNAASCLVVILLNETGRNIWGTALHVPHPEPEVVEWLQRRAQQLGRQWSGELVGEMIAELGAEPRKPNFLPATPATP